MIKSLRWIHSDDVGCDAYVTPSLEILDFAFEREDRFLLFQGIYKDDQGQKYLVFGHEETFVCYAFPVGAGD